jgi:hypothetical protein
VADGEGGGLIRILILFMLASAAPMPKGSESCAVLTPELRTALNAVHAARDGSPIDSARAIRRWLPKATKELSSVQPPAKEWLHLAVDLGRELIRLERTNEARRLLSRVRERDPDGDWGSKAASHIQDMDLAR